MNQESLENEIKASKEAIKSLKETRDKCNSGIEVQEFVLKKFEEEWKAMS